MFANACRQSTDFHFPSIDDQLDLVRQFATKLAEDRLLHPPTTPLEENPSTSSLSSRQNSLVATPERSREPSVERYENIIKYSTCTQLFYIIRDYVFFGFKMLTASMIRLTGS